MTALAVVQTAANAYNHLGNGEPDCRTAHFGVAPTSGNLLIACMCYTNTITPISGWTLIPGSQHTGLTGGVVGFYKYAGASESTAQVVTNTTQTFGSIECWEISGVSGTWATDYVASTFVGNTSGSSGTSFTDGAYVTANNNALVLAFIDGENGIAYATPTAMAKAGSGTLVADDHVGAASPGPSGTSVVGGHYTLVAASGTSLQESTSTANSSYWGYAHVELQSSASSSTETATVAMALGGVSFGAAANDHHAGAALALTGVSFNSGGGLEELGSASIVLGRANFNVAGVAGVAATATLALSGVTIKAAGIDLGAAGTGAVHFATFGA